MTAPVQSNSVLVSGVSSGSIALPGNATLGNLLTLTVSWIDGASVAAETLSVPTDANGTWLVAKNPLSAFNSGAVGAAIFYEQVASATTHNSTVSPPTAGANLFALITIAEWPPGTLDVVQSNLNNSAASITSLNSGATGAVASSSDFSVACCALNCGTGTSNSGISDPAVGYTASLGVSQDNSVTVGAESSYLSATGTGAQTATWNCTANATMLCYQAAIATFQPTRVLSAPIARGFTPGRSPGKTGARFERLILSTTVLGGATINASIGTYSWVGTTSNASGLINEAIGSYTWAGTTATINDVINATVAGYSWSGTTAVNSGLINGIVGSYSWAGTTSTLIENISQSIGAYSWAGAIASLSQLINAGIGAYAWSATTGTLGNPIIGIPGTFTWSGTNSDVPIQISSDPTFGFIWSGTNSNLIVATGDTHDGGTQVVRESHYRKKLRLPKKALQRQDLIDEEIARLIAEKPVSLQKVVDDDEAITVYLAVESSEIDELTHLAGELVSHLTKGVR